MEINNELSKFEENKRKIMENIDAAKEMKVCKITAILAMDDEGEDTQNKLINWLVVEGYKVSLRRDVYNILTVEWE